MASVDSRVRSPWTISIRPPRLALEDLHQPQSLRQLRNSREKVSAPCRSRPLSLVVRAGGLTNMLTATKAKAIATTAARILLGLVFFVFGLDGFLHFVPQPTTPPPEGAMALGIAFMKSGYLFQLIKGTEVLVGALLPRQSLRAAGAHPARARAGQHRRLPRLPGPRRPGDAGVLVALEARPRLGPPRRLPPAARAQACPPRERLSPGTRAQCDSS